MQRTTDEIKRMGVDRGLRAERGKWSGWTGGRTKGRMKAEKQTCRQADERTGANSRQTYGRADGGGVATRTRVGRLDGRSWMDCPKCKTS